jgi:hypothetical protein
VNFFTESDPLQPVVSNLISRYSNIKSSLTGKSPKIPRYFIQSIKSGGKLVTLASTRGAVDYDLPSYIPPFSTCEYIGKSYVLDTLYIAPALKSYVNKNQIVDSLLYISSNKVAAYAVRDTFYTEEHYYRNNLHVKFYERVGTSYPEFKWREEYCLSFDARFRPFSDGKSPVEGTIAYPMKSNGFNAIFGSKTIYLEFEINDRSLNRSNPEKTIEFTLNEIKQ